MSGNETISALKTTWRLFWGQKLGRVLVAIFAGLAAVYLFEIGPAIARRQLSLHLDRLLLPGLIVLLFVRTRGTIRTEERRYWNFIGLGMVVWLAGSVLNYATLVLGLPRWADLGTDVLYILLYLCWFVASDQQPQLESGWSTRDVLYRFSLVGATLFVAIMFGYFVAVPWAVQPSENVQYFASFNLYVVLDILLAAKFGLLFAAARESRWRRGFFLMAAVTAVMAIGDLLEGLGFADILPTVVGGRIDIIWLVPHLCIAVMILTCTDKPEAAGEVEGGTIPRVQSLLPFYAFALPLVHLGLYLMGYLDPEARASREAIVFVGLVLFAVLSLFQQVRLEHAVASLRSDLVFRALDDKLRQSQRLESIGRLAGGIAHDFNNLLMVIKSYVQLARQGLPPEAQPVGIKLIAIDQAADRAAELIRQLLAFGRRQVLRPEVVRVNELITGLESMLSRIIGDDMELVVDLDPDTGSTRVDPALLEQVIVNLVVNARDAMPRGGRVTIRARSVAERSDVAPNFDAEGPSVEMAVSDTGVGIDHTIRDRIFEPYFTTKEMEKGTGLGLATVYGIVEQSGGSIIVESEQGVGSTFRVRFPQVEGPALEQVAPAPAPARSVAGTTVLLTEDEKNIREALAEYLAGLGMVVLQAEDGVAALEIAADHDGPIDVLVTDLVMPRMSGPELATRLVSLRRDLEVIFVSGYTPETMGEYGAATGDAVFLQKPFLLEDLANTIREVTENRT